MRRIKCILTYVAFASAAAALLVSCQREEEMETGQEVVFSALTTYDNLPYTRTIYSGEFATVEGQKKERINWETTDKVKILNTNTNASAEYKVDGGVTNSGEKSSVQIAAVVPAEKLTWGTGSSNTFLAVYPSSAMNSSNAIGANIPASQPQTNKTNALGEYTNPGMSDYAFMVAKVTADNGSTVTLPFNPAMTAFEFNVAFANDGGVPPTVTSFEMISTSTPLVGDWSWDGSNFTCPTTLVTSGTNANNKITVNFGSRQVTANNPLKFTVFALPQNLTNVKIVFHLEGGVDKTLSLTGNTFYACKKYRITTPGLPGSEVWDFYIEEIPNIVTYGHDIESGLSFTIKSYKVKNGDMTTKVDVPWQAVVTAATGNEATTSNLTITDPTGTGSGAGVGNSANIIEASTAVIEGGGTPGEAAAAKMATNPVKGSSDSRYDLSMYDVHGTAHNQETANCYVINSPGFYKFPLVYGNARKNGGDNTVAWAPTATDNSNRYMTPFLRSDNQGITGPYILTNMGLSASDVEAAIVWQDVPETSLILKENTTEETNYGILDEGNGYIWFNIEKTNIKQGNVVIAVRKKSDHSILWSWHLWFTEKTLTPIRTKVHPQRTTAELEYVDFMPYNLGWTDRTNATTHAYPTRTWTVTVSQTETGSDASPVTFTVKQIGEVDRIEANIGACTFYEFGRKDPELPFKDSNNNKEYTAGWKTSTTRYPVAAGSNTLTVVTPSGSMDAGTGIQNPNAHSFGSNTTCWLGNTSNSTPVNLWSANITGNVQDIATVKTVYDPCPPGFSVPRLHSFSNFAKTNDAPTNQIYDINGTRVGADYGYDFPTGYGNGKIFFPASGSRAHNDAGPQYLDEWGNYWTAAAVEYGGAMTHGKTLNFQFVYYIDQSRLNVVNVQFDRWKSCAYTVRPSVDTSPDPSSGGGEGGGGSDTGYTGGSNETVTPPGNGSY